MLDGLRATWLSVILNKMWICMYVYVADLHRSTVLHMLTNIYLMGVYGSSPACVCIDTSQTLCVRVTLLYTIVLTYHIA